jgi:hypothetical protein
MIHRLDRAQTFGSKKPLRLDPTDDDKTLGELQLEKVNGCRLAVEIAPTGVWQEPRAFKAFKWTQGGLTRVTVQLPIPDSPSVLQIDLDVDWDSILSDVKKRATSLLKEKIKALSPAQQQALAGSQKINDVNQGAKGAKKEVRLVFQSASWGEQGFTVTDETASLRDIYQPYITFDDESEVAPLPVKVLARLMPTTSSVAAAASPSTDSGGLPVRMEARALEAISKKELVLLVQGLASPQLLQASQLSGNPSTVAKKASKEKVRTRSSAQHARKHMLVKRSSSSSAFFFF